MNAIKLRVRDDGQEFSTAREISIGYKTMRGHLGYGVLRTADKNGMQIPGFGGKK